MPKVLTAWIGKADLRAAAATKPAKGPIVAALNAYKGKDGAAFAELKKTIMKALLPKAGLGPIAEALKSFDEERQTNFDELHLLHNEEPETIGPYIEWLSQRTTATINTRHEALETPMYLPGIYKAARECLLALEETHQDTLELTCHLSPGTPFMAACWLMLVKMRFPAELIITSPEAGLQTVYAPFQLHAELLPDVFSQAGSHIESAHADSEARLPEFKELIHSCKAMKTVIQRAAKAAMYDLPILLQGESGTGKELFAKAIHRTSGRKGRFVPINCGALPSELVEAILFGNVKGAYTGADTARSGAFVDANHGTLFLDEIGELSLSAQVKILRVLEAKEVTPVGGTKVIPIKVRLVAATHRDLKAMVAKRAFREDLFYRLAVAVLTIPALRNRPGDLNLLLDSLMDRVNDEMSKVAQRKELSAGARNIAASYDWPGNVREVYNTLRRAVLWTETIQINEADFQAELMPMGRNQSDAILGRDITEKIQLKDLVNEVRVHYLQRALKLTNGNKTQAAELLGLGSQQTFTNWLKQSGLG
jgi:DNA-binding NtrC family response regulator